MAEKAISWIALVLLDESSTLHLSPFTTYCFLQLAWYWTSLATKSICSIWTKRLVSCKAFAALIILDCASNVSHLVRYSLPLFRCFVLHEQNMHLSGKTPVELHDGCDSDLRDRSALLGLFPVLSTSDCCFSAVKFL